MNIIFMIKIKILMLVKWSYWSPPIMLPMELILVIIFWAGSPLSFEQMSFFYPFLEPHLSYVYLNLSLINKDRIAPIFGQSFLLSLKIQFEETSYHVYTLQDAYVG